MSRPSELPRPPTDRTYALSIADLQRSAARGALAAPRLLRGTPPANQPPVEQALPDGGITPCGLQEFVSLSDDLLLVRADARSTSESAERQTSWEIDTRGWLYLHFRLDGISVDRPPDGPARTVGGGSFLVCASSRPSAFAREVLSDVWQVVTIAFRPSDTFQNLPVAGMNLPSELKRFRAGDADVDFLYASPFTPDMRSAAGALLRPAVSGGMRPFYLRAKAVELVCLAVEQVGKPSPQAEPAFKLGYRDVRALEEAKHLVDQATQNQSLDQLARRVGINRRKLALGFKLLFGTTVGEYQREVRLDAARRMLETGAASVGYAATVAGYSDVGSFGKAFKTKYGSLPSQSRSSGGWRGRH